MGNIWCFRVIVAAAATAGLAAPGTAGAAEHLATCANLAGVVMAAGAGDTVTLSGICESGVDIDRDLTLRGNPADGIDGFEGVAERPAVRLSALFSAPEVDLEDLTFRGNRGLMGSGGAIQVEGCFDLTVRRSTFVGNAAGGDGGAIAAQLTCMEASATIAGGSVTLIDSVFGGAEEEDVNTAGGRGGAVWMTADNTALTVSGSTFQGNRAGGSGGGVAVQDGTAQTTSVGGRTTVTDSAFVDNLGGTAVATGETATGGALSLTTTAGGTSFGWITLTGNDFTGNRLDDADGSTGTTLEGGAVAVQRASNVGSPGTHSVALDGNAFTANTIADGTGHGGALSVRGWDLTSYRDAFVQNTITGDGDNDGGGAVWLAGQAAPGGSVNSDSGIYGAVLLRNGVPADGSGGALRVSEADGGQATASIRQTTILGSTGPETGVHGSTGTVVGLANSIVHGSGAAPGTEISGTATAATSNVDGTDPRLTADGHETAASPGINQGATAGADLFPGIPAPALDLDGVGRIAGPAPDLGADEQAIADLAVTLDAQPSFASPGGTIVYVARVENAGDDLATGSRAVLTLPPGTTPTDIRTDYGSCAPGAGSTVACDLGALPLYEVARVSARIVAPGAGPVTATLTAAADNPDPTPASTSAVTQISQPAPPAATPTPDATPTPTPVAPLKATDVLTLPGTSRCVSRRVFSLRLKAPRGTTLTKVVVRVGDAKARTYTGKSLATRKIDLRGLPRGTARVRITVTLSDRRTVTVTRTYRTCALRKKT